MIEDDRAGPGGTPLDFKIGDCTAPMEHLYELLRDEYEMRKEAPRGLLRTMGIAGIRNDTMLALERLRERVREIERLAAKMCHEDMMGLYEGSKDERADKDSIEDLVAVALLRRA
jgi:hypothetical protein